MPSHHQTQSNTGPNQKPKRERSEIRGKRRFWKKRTRPDQRYIHTQIPANGAVPSPPAGWLNAAAPALRHLAEHTNSNLGRGAFPPSSPAARDRPRDEVSSPQGIRPDAGGPFHLAGAAVDGERGGSPAAYVSRWCTRVTPVPVRSCESHEHAMPARNRLSLLRRYDWRWYNIKYYCKKQKKG